MKICYPTYNIRSVVIVPIPSEISVNRLSRRRLRYIRKKGINQKLLIQPIKLAISISFVGKLKRIACASCSFGTPLVFSKIFTCIFISRHHVIKIMIMIPIMIINMIMVMIMIMITITIKFKIMTMIKFTIL